MATRTASLVAKLAAVALLLGVSACADRGGPPFAGIEGAYVVSGGDRRLELNGDSGTYTAVTPGGVQTEPVTLDESDLWVGTRQLPYLAKDGIILAGGYSGFAADSVVSDPREVPGTYTTMTGSNFAGELRIETSGAYVWCMRSRIDGDSCADGSSASRGDTRVQPRMGFSFTGVPGVYAIHRRGAAAAIFPVGAQSLRLMAFTRASKEPRGSFAQPPPSVVSDAEPMTVTFETGAVKVTGGAAWSGSYAYVVEDGVIRFASDACPDGVCNAIYNDDLGTLYAARLGNGLFIR